MCLFFGRVHKNVFGDGKIVLNLRMEIYDAPETFSILKKANHDGAYQTLHSVCSNVYF